MSAFGHRDAALSLPCVVGASGAACSSRSSTRGARRPHALGRDPGRRVVEHSRRAWRQRGRTPRLRPWYSVQRLMLMPQERQVDLRTDAERERRPRHLCHGTARVNRVLDRLAALEWADGRGPVAVRTLVALPRRVHVPTRGLVVGRFPADPDGLPGRDGPRPDPDAYALARAHSSRLSRGIRGQVPDLQLGWTGRHRLTSCALPRHARHRLSASALKRSTSISSVISSWRRRSQRRRSARASSSMRRIAVSM